MYQTVKFKESTERCFSSLIFILIFLLTLTLFVTHNAYFNGPN